MDDQASGKTVGGTVATGCLQGFGGCFGFIAAGVVILFALLVLSQCHAAEERRAIETGAVDEEREDSGRIYVSHCAMGLSKARREFPRMKGAELIPSVAPLARSSDEMGTVVQCPVAGRNGVGGVVIRVRCGDALQSHCTEVLTATLP